MRDDLEARTRTTILKPIAEAIEKGETKYKRIAKATGLDEHFVAHFLNNIGLNHEQLKINLLKRAYDVEGIRDIGEAIKFTKLTEETIRRYEPKIGKHFTGTVYGKIRARHPEIDNSIKNEEGLNMPELGRLVESKKYKALSRQRVDQYLRGTNQYDAWKAQRVRKWVKND